MSLLVAAVMPLVTKSCGYLVQNSVQTLRGRITRSNEERSAAEPQPKPFNPQPKAQALRKCMRCFMHACAFGCGLNEFARAARILTVCSAKNETSEFFGSLRCGLGAICDRNPLPRVGRSP